RRTSSEEDSFETMGLKVLGSPIVAMTNRPPGLPGSQSATSGGSAIGALATFSAEPLSRLQLATARPKMLTHRRLYFLLVICLSRPKLSHPVPRQKSLAHLAEHCRALLRTAQEPLLRRRRRSSKSLADSLTVPKIGSFNVRAP